MNAAIDITANWQAAEGWSDRILVREPAVANEEVRRFRQRILLPAGSHEIELIYDATHDYFQPPAVDDTETLFRGLCVDGRPGAIELGPRDQSGQRRGRLRLDRTEAGSVELEMRLGATRPMRTVLHSDTCWPRDDRYVAVAPESADQVVLARGIPFRTHGVDAQFIGAWLDRRERTGLGPRDAGGWSFPCGDVAARRIHFAGMISSIDVANGSWYNAKGDHGCSHFPGDRVGVIRLRWSNDSWSEVPLVYGFNFWYGRPWDINWFYAPYSRPYMKNPNTDADMFGGDPAPREVIRSAVHLVDGERSFGGLSNAVRYVFTLETGGRQVREIVIRGTPGMHGYPLIGGITLERDTPAETATAGFLPLLTRDAPVVCPADLEYACSEAWREGVARVQDVLCASRSRVPELAAPVIPQGYFGPGYDFAGTQTALRTATFLYHNGPECAAHIADSGTGCSSSTARKAVAHYTMGMGVWRTEKALYDGLGDFLERYRQGTPGAFPGRGNAWSRGIGELVREALAFGYDKYVDTYIDWLDRCLFEDATPPHWIRCPGRGTASEGTQRRMVGDQEETGNRENDGHGICMWGRYMAWHWQGRPWEWNQRHWQATAAAADWILWQLETEPLFPGLGKDVLYTESECAHGDSALKWPEAGFSTAEIYSSYNCLHGLKLAIRMADQLGESVAAARWRQAHARLRRGILEHLTVESPEGRVWLTEARCDWQDHAHKLVHLHLATEGDSYTPLRDYAAGDELEQQYLEISRNSYRHLMRAGSYDCLRMYGYGQGMMLQAALLLDEMADAEQFLEKLVTYAYLPHLEGWLAPEGIIVHRDGDLYVPVNGYMGQDGHLADSTKALRLMLGVDDNDPDHLRLVPRFPASWSRWAVRDWPVLIGNRRQTCSFAGEREPGCLRFSFSTSAPIGRVSVRLGPFGLAETISRILVDGEPASYHGERSGDSQWVWIHNLANVTELELELCNRNNI